MIFKILKLADKDTVKAYIDKLPEGKKYEVSISLQREKRSINQNALYWLWVACICEDTGNSKQTVHRELGMKYLPHISGKLGVEPISTTSLDTLKMKNYLDEVCLWGAEYLGIILPNPEDKYWAEFYDKYKNLL
jgi:hypothetical protein